MALNRSKLPNRRPSVTRKISWREAQGHSPFFVTVGFDTSTGDPREVFYADGMKTGTDLLHTVQDGCILISLALQRGESLKKIQHSLSDDSVLAAIVRTAVDEPVG